MQEELNQIERNHVWELVRNTLANQVMGTRWVFCNKLDEGGKVLRNKARLIAKECNQQKDIDFKETYALVARLEAIRMLLDFSSIMNFKIIQIDVKCVLERLHPRRSVC